MEITAKQIKKIPFERRKEFFKKILPKLLELKEVLDKGSKKGDTYVK
jgi:hypothetical protein